MQVNNIKVVMTSKKGSILVDGDDQERPLVGNRTKHAACALHGTETRPCRDHEVKI